MEQPLEIGSFVFRGAVSNCICEHLTKQCMKCTEMKIVGEFGISRNLVISLFITHWPQKRDLRGRSRT